jgi:hypothetical protein
MLTVAESYFESDDFGGDVILHAAFSHSLLNAARIVSCVLTTGPMLSPGILSLVSINAIVLIVFARPRYSPPAGAGRGG